MHREQDRLLPLRERRRAALTLERSAALFVVARSILAAFARIKVERGALDFNDQIRACVGAGHAVERRVVLGWLDSSWITCCSTKPRTHLNRNGGILAALSAEFLQAPAHGQEPLRIRGRRREAMRSSTLPKHGGRDVRGNEARIFEKRHREGCGSFRGIPADLLAPIGAENSRRRRRAPSHRLWLGAAAQRDGAAAKTRRDWRFASGWRGRAVAADQSQAPRAGAGRLAPCLSNRQRTILPWFSPRRIAEVIKAWLRPTAPERVVDPGNPAKSGASAKAM